MSYDYRNAIVERIGSIEDIPTWANAGAAMGASLGSIIPGLGTSIGTFVGTIVGSIAGYLAEWLGLADTAGEMATKLADTQFADWFKKMNGVKEPKAVYEYSKWWLQSELFANDMVHRERQETVFNHILAYFQGKTKPEQSLFIHNHPAIPHIANPGWQTPEHHAYRLKAWRDKLNYLLGIGYDKAIGKLLTAGEWELIISAAADKLGVPAEMKPEYISAMMQTLAPMDIYSAFDDLAVQFKTEYKNYIVAEFANRLDNLMRGKYLTMAMTTQPKIKKIMENDKWGLNWVKFADATLESDYVKWINTIAPKGAFEGAGAGEPTAKAGEIMLLVAAALILI